MTDISHNLPTIVHYSADYWEHFCPVQRVVEPAQRSGYQVVHGNEWDHAAGRLDIYPERVRDADLVVIQRDFPRHFEDYQEIMAIARSMHKPVIYEWDDLLTDLPKEHPNYEQYMSVRSRVMTAIIEADAVTCATPFLADYVRQYNPQAWVLPNYINDRFWQLRPVRVEDSGLRPLIIGYLGAHSHQPDLEMIAPVLESLLQFYGERLRLQFWNIQPPESLASLPNVEKPWPGLVDYRAFAAYFLQQSFDIAIAPLLVSDFNRGKSWQKYLEYSALGVPGVYSRITPYEVVVRHGTNGFLAQSLSEWEKYLRQLIDDDSLRRQMGQAAQETVRDSWMLSSHVQSWQDVYNQVASLPHEKHRSISMAAQKFIAWEQELLENSEKARQGFEHSLAEKESTIQNLNQLVQDQTETIASLNQGVRDQTETIASLNLTVRDQTETIEGLNQALREHELTIHSLRERIDEVDATSQVLQLQLDENELAITALQQQVEEKEADNLAVRGSLYETSKTLKAITSSPGWKLLEMVYRVRLILVPRGSTRERLMHMAIKSAHALRTTGFRGFFQKVSSNLGSRPDTVAQVPAAPQFSFEVTSGKACPDPAISLVIIEGEGFNRLRPEAVVEWAERQTIGRYEIVHWDMGLAAAKTLGGAERKWQSENVMQLCQGLQGRYLCLAADDLLLQSSTYLEENLLALEGEQLAFTVNSSWRSQRAYQHLSQGLLPGSKTQPLQSMFVRKDCVAEGFAIDLSDRMKSGENSQIVAGKLIRQITSREANQEYAPFEMTLDGYETRLEGDYILARRKSELPWQSQVHWLRALDASLSLDAIPSDLPTVLMVFPFLAVGGAEQLGLNVISGLKSHVRFIVIATDELDPSLGTLADDFRQETPWVYNFHDFLHPALHFSFLNNLVTSCQPACLYIANGSPWIYDVLPELKQRYPDLRTVNQVYDLSVGWINRYDMSLLLALDGHIGANDNICQAYIEKGARPDQVYLVEHGIDPAGLNPDKYSRDDKDAVLRRLGLPEGKKIVTFASRIHPQKRPMDFVEMARRFSGDQSVIFLMMGDGPLVGILDHQVQKMGLKNFYRCGFYRPISDILAISDVVVLPSEYEGMPMIIAEAQLMGIPVVVTDVGNNRRVLEITGGGEIIDQIGSVEALVRGVRKMLTSPPEATSMRRAYLSSFGIDVIAQKYLDALLGRPHA